MALIKCPECGKEISDQEDFCPNCGYDLEGKKRRKKYARNGRDKTSTGMILHSIATIFWAGFFIYIFLVLGGINIQATKDTYRNTYVNPYSWESRHIYDSDTQYIDSDKVNEYQSAGYNIKYFLGDNENWQLTSPTSFYSELCGIILSCILGFILFFIKDKNKLQFILSFFYLGITAITMVTFMYTTMGVFIFTIGFFGITLVPFILQIVAAFKYMAGARLIDSAALEK